jgi:hypothetical protein
MKFKIKLFIVAFMASITLTALEAPEDDGGPGARWCRCKPSTRDNFKICVAGNLISFRKICLAGGGDCYDGDNFCIDLSDSQRD